VVDTVECGEHCISMAGIRGTKVQQGRLLLPYTFQDSFIHILQFYVILSRHIITSESSCSSLVSFFLSRLPITSFLISR